MSGYIGTQPVPQATQTRDSFTATAGQTTFATSGYTPLYLDLFKNGIHLVNNTDYTATNGSDVVLASGAAAGDVIEVVAYTTFEISGVTGLTPSIDDNGNATAITIDSSENVGIGTSSPSSNLHVKTSVDNSLTQGLIIERSANSDKGYINYQAGAFQIRATDGDPIAFGQVSNERMRIDSSGNLLVGNTDTSPYDRTSGNAIAIGDGLISSAQSGGNAAIFNRMTSDGSIVGFRKDGGTVGSIVVDPSNIAIGSGDTGIYFNSGDDALIPVGTGNNLLSSRDNAIDLGRTNTRFKDAYIGGGVYVGGTAAANKFDDLESGTWTPQDNSGNNWTQSSTAKYYKIGDLVTCWFDISHNANIGSNANKLGNFPYTSDSGSNYAGTQGYTTSNSSITFHLGSNSKLADFYVANVSTQMTGRLIGSITYRTA